MPEDQIKFKVITGKGEEKEIQPETKKEFKIPLKLLTKKPEAEKESKRKELKTKKTFKFSKRHIKFLVGFILIGGFSLGSYLVLKNWNSISKNFSLFSSKPKEKKESPHQPTSSEALKLLLEKLKSTPTKETLQENLATLTTPTPIFTPTTSTITPPQTNIIETTTITFASPTISTTSTENQIEKIEPPSPKSEEIKEIKVEEIPLQKTKDVILSTNLNLINIELEELNENGFKKAWLNALKIQKEAGSIYEINFLYNNSKILSELVRNYFIKPSFIEEKHSDEFKKLLVDYKIVFYYTHTRKYPLLIFKVNNDSFAITFMRLWDKESLLKDMYNIYLGLPKGRLIRNFTITEEYSKVKYKIAYYDNDYKLIWTIYNNYLIISTSLNAFKYIINLLK